MWPAQGPTDKHVLLARLLASLAAAIVLGLLGGLVGHVFGGAATTPTPWVVGAVSTTIVTLFALVVVSTVLYFVTRTWT